MDEASSALMFLGHFHMNCPNNLALGLGRMGDIIGRASGRRGWPWVF